MHYKSLQEFYDDCYIGMDIEFAYAGIEYGVYNCDANGPIAYRKDAFGFYDQQFKTPDELLDGFFIEGKRLRDIITEIEILLH